MFSLTKSILLVGVFTCCALEASAIQLSSQPITLEFRRAETKPGKGLTEATIESTGAKIYLHKEVILSKRDVVMAQVSPQSGSELYELSLDFTDRGAKKMERATKQHMNRPLAILIDGRVVAAPLLRSIIRDKARIFGQISKQEADRIANLIASQPQPQTHKVPSLILGQRKIDFELRLAEILPQNGLNEASVGKTLEKVYLHKEVLISNKDVIEARAVKVHYSDGVFEVLLTLTKEGGERMARASDYHKGKPLAVLINGKVVSVPFIIGMLSEQISISGEFTKEEADWIASRLTSK